MSATTTPTTDEYTAMDFLDDLDVLGGLVTALDDFCMHGEKAGLDLHEAQPLAQLVAHYAACVRDRAEDVLARARRRGGS